MSHKFLMDSNLGLRPDEQPWHDLFAQAGIEPISTSDLERADKIFADHVPGIAFLPSADVHRLFGRGDHYYQGLAESTSKFTGEPTMKVLLVVKKDDPATSLDDLAGAKLGYINRSCSSTYFPPAILLNRKGLKLDDYFELTRIPVGYTWQELNDAVVSGMVRASMVLEDVWKTFPRNAGNTKIIGEYPGSKGALVVVRDGFDQDIRATLLDAFLNFQPPWDSIYGAYKPYYLADMLSWFHDLDQLPPGT
jgi:phosphonate transport system substrate-binding protein